MDTLDFEPTLKTKAIVVKSAVDKQHDPVIMIAELGPGEAGPPTHVHPSQHETYDVLEGVAAINSAAFLCNAIYGFG